MQSRSESKLAAILFLLFVVSGFCGLVYQVVWLRLAFAAFGVITPVLSIVVSVFMLGLSVGSWAAGKWIGPLTARTRISAVWYYGFVELLIGIGGISVPRIFDFGQRMLLPAGSMDSFTYLLYSALVLGLSILPWCICMGATFPFMMAFIRMRDPGSSSSFSYLYLGNVIGAMCGVALSVALIELSGFRSTLLATAICNFAIAGTSFLLGVRNPWTAAPEEAAPAPAAEPAAATRAAVILAILFATGFVSMAMEVVWTRAFTPVLRTTIYSFAALLATYLLATWVGCLAYRRNLARGSAAGIDALLGMLALAAFLPIIANDPRWPLPFVLRIVVVLAGIAPFCGLLGYLTPMLVDRYSAGSPRSAGYAYAVNVVGCILGPLFASYALLPSLGVRQSLVLLALPLAAFYIGQLRRARFGLAQAGTLALVGILLFGSLRLLTSYEDTVFWRRALIRRDHVATVIANGEGMGKRLYVNGISLTCLTPITKVMAHVPLAALKEKPDSVLVICFGMGTTFRSASRWDVDVTGVELVPSVPEMFGYYHSDSREVLARPNVRVVVDDGRRYLKRVERAYDLITIDPPPPLEAAGSSLLYSVEFYELAKQRLSEDGILAQWLLGGEKESLQAAIRAICMVFPHVRAFVVKDQGIHLFASMKPVELPSPDEFVRRLPKAAQSDFVEWQADKDPRSFYEMVLSCETAVDELLDSNPSLVIRDNRPFNEYFLVRRATAGLLQGK